MGRPSLASIRTEQILEAVEQSILEAGVDGTTVANVARIAGMRPSHVHHYLGGREAMMDAAVRRAIARVEQQIDEAVAGMEPTSRLDALLDVLFDTRLAVPAVNQMIDELIATSYRDPVVHELVIGMYARFSAIIDDQLAEAYPLVSPLHRRPVAHALLALAHASATFEWLKIDPHHYRHARQAAQALVTQMAGAPGAD